MAGQLRAIKRRIGSVQSTKKITRAMELIAATRVAKSQQRVQAARPYSEQITSVIQHMAEAGGAGDHPLLRPADDVKKVCYVVITGDRGLAGAYNSNAIRAAEREMQARRTEGRDYSLVVCGKKGVSYFRFRGFKIAAEFTGMSDTPTYEDARLVAETVSDLFESGEVQEVVLVFTRFLSVGTQRVTVRQFMPLTGVGAEEAPTGATADYEFEPGPGEILGRLLPRYVEARLFAAMLDAAASEHAARQRAMKSATDNGDELITKLSRIMNGARQDSITPEIMEIVSGAEALRSGQSDITDLLADGALNVVDMAGHHGAPVPHHHHHV